MQSKLPNVGTTIFTVMSQLAQQHQAINLGQGFPDFQMDQTLIDLVHRAMQDGHNQYTHMNGLPALRNAIANKVQDCYHQKINPETEITVTPGGTYAIYTAITTVLQEGDEVIYFEPGYDCYVPAIELCKAKPIPIALNNETFAIPWDKVKSSITSKTSMIILNTPHNPTGMVLSKDDVDALRQIVQNTNIVILSDEVYEHLIYDGLTHHSLLKYDDLRARSFVCFSFGKTYHCTGWKLGYCIAPENWMKEFRKVHQFNAFSCDTPKQVALATYLQNPSAYKNLGTALQQKRDYFRTLMQQTPLQCIPSHGSYFECYSYKGLSKLSEYDFALQLTAEAGVATIPLSAFYTQPQNNFILRFCFAKKETTLAAAAEKLAQYFAS